MRYVESRPGTTYEKKPLLYDSVTQDWVNYITPNSHKSQMPSAIKYDVKKFTDKEIAEEFKHNHDYGADIDEEWVTATSLKPQIEKIDEEIDTFYSRLSRKQMMAGTIGKVVDEVIDEKTSENIEKRKKGIHKIELPYYIKFL